MLFDTILIYGFVTLKYKYTEKTVSNNQIQKWLTETVKNKAQWFNAQTLANGPTKKQKYLIKYLWGSYHKEMVWLHSGHLKVPGLPKEFSFFISIGV